MMNFTEKDSEERERGEREDDSKRKGRMGGRGTFVENGKGQWVQTETIVEDLRLDIEGF